jgi:molecular chaperone GrpE (heat shock protein)
MPDKAVAPVPVGESAPDPGATGAVADGLVQESASSPSPTSGGVRTEEGGGAPSGEPGPAAAATADGLDCVHDGLLRVQDGVDALLKRFDEKLLHDEARADEVKRLNAELAKHQPDAKWNTVRPFLDQMVRHLDEIQRFVRRYEGGGDVSVKDVLEAFNWLHEDIELALEEHDITAFRPRAGEDAFDGRRHSVAGSPIATTDASLERVVERCVRPGFERNGKVVARAAVRIYRHTEDRDSHYSH